MTFNPPITVPTIELYFYFSGVMKSPVFSSFPVSFKPSTLPYGLLSLHSDLWAQIPLLLSHSKTETTFLPTRNAITFRTTQRIKRNRAEQKHQFLNETSRSTGFPLNRNRTFYSKRHQDIPVILTTGYCGFLTEKNRIWLVCGFCFSHK